MYKRNKKGFSLIELLAVVIILAILALITIPIVGNLIKQARINAAVVSAYGYVEATNNEVVSKQTKGENVLETTYNIDDYNIVGDALNVRYEGKGPLTGWFTISRSKVKEGEFCINGYDVKYEDGKATYVKDGEVCPGAPLPPIGDLCAKDKKPEVDKEYAIRNIEDLVCFSEKVNSGNDFSGTTVVLEKDLDFNDAKSYTSGVVDTTLTTGSGFCPIGNETNIFKGVFDGKSHSINNLFISVNKKYTGLFGYIDSAVIENINFNNYVVSNSYNSSDGKTGGVVGQSVNSSINNIIVNSSRVSSYYNTGGIIGYLDKNSSLSEFTINTLTLSGSYYVGGVVGYNFGLVQLANINGLTITGNSHLGGIVGANGSSSDKDKVKIKNIVARGSVTGRNDIIGGAASENYGDIDGVVLSFALSGSENVGGVTHYSYSGSIKAVVEGGSIATSYNYRDYNGLGGKALGLYYSGSFSGKIFTSTDITTSRVRYDYWWYGSYSRADDGISYDSSYHNIAMFDDVLDTYYGGDSDGNNYYFDFESDDSNRLVLKKVDEHSFDTQISGDGTESNPYILATERDFKDAALLVNQNKNFRISDDVDISTFNHFYPLGTTNFIFNSNLDGNNKTISNMNINVGQYGGLIGYLNGGTVRNISIADSNVRGRYGSGGRTGGLVGNVTSSLISNIAITNSNVSGSDYHGGVIGYLDKNSSLSEFTINTLTVSGATNTGGAVGASYGVVQIANMNGISVTGSSYVGGIVGINGSSSDKDKVKIKDIVARGSASGSASYIGGAAGENYGDIDGVVLSFTLSGSEYVGGVTSIMNAGTVKAVVEGGSIATSYNDRDYNGLGGKAISLYPSGGYSGRVFTSTDITTSRVRYDYWWYGSYTRADDGDSYDPTYHTIAMYDDVLDTYYGGDSDGNNYYFDFESDNSNRLILKKVDAHSFDTQISGGGTESNPYILATERDFKDAALLVNQNKYFKIANNIDVSTFNHFYPLGTTNFVFSGYLDGNNKTISNMYITGGRYRGFVSYLNGGTIKDLTINSSEIKGGYGSGNITGMVVGNTTNASITNVNVLNSSVRKSESSYAGGIVGIINGTLDTATITNTDVRDGNYTGGVVGYIPSSQTVRNLIVNMSDTVVSGSNYTGGIVGKLEGTLSSLVLSINKLSVSGSAYVGGLIGEAVGFNYNNIEINEISVSGSSTDIGGLFGISSNTTLNGVSINKSTISGGSSHIGGLFGNASNTNANWVNINKSTISSSGTYVGGVAGYSSVLNVAGMNLKDLSLTGTQYTGGLVGDAYKAVFREVSIRGSVTGTEYVGGVFGYSGDYWANGEAHSVYLKVNVTGTSSVGGFVGYPAYYGEYNTQIVGVLDEGSSVNNPGRSAGKAIGGSGPNRGLKYVSESVTTDRASATGQDGTSYSLEHNGDLSYFSGITFEGEVLLESPNSGDVNNNGYWFNYDSNKEIYVMKVSDYTPTEIEIGEETDDDDDTVIITETHQVDACESGDITPPTCVFRYLGPISKGIMAEFSCTDDSGVPDVYSMFNSEKQVTYTAQEILDRTGTQKTGTVNGNTRNITSRWTTDYSGNKPELNRCYYYQYTAVDACGNSRAYVTNFCREGFSNS